MTSQMLSKLDNLNAREMGDTSSNHLPMALKIRTQATQQTSDQSTNQTAPSGAKRPSGSSGTISNLNPSFIRLDHTKFDDRLVVCVTGMHKTGKDHFTLTAPDPIFHQGIDPAGLEGVANKFQDKEIYVSPNEYYVDIQPDDNGDEDKIARAAEPVWNQFVRDFYHGLDMLDKAKLESGRIGTVVWSAESDAWELLRLARFGVLNPRTGRDRGNVWGPVNAEYKRLLQEPFHRGFNFIMVDKQKDEYKDDKKTGKKVRTGFGDVPWIAQVVVETKRQKRADGSMGFSLLVTDCRHNPGLMGEEIPDNDFGMLKQFVMS